MEQIRGRQVLVPWTLAGLLALAIPGPALADPPSVEIIGTAVLPPEIAADAAGTPRPASPDLARWAAQAASRIVAAYKAKGYRFARAWSTVTTDGQVRIEVDEGRMSGIVFLGATPEQAILFRVDLSLPGDVFHAPTLARQLKELKAKYNLVAIEWRVVDREELVPNRLGQPVVLRGLRIIVTRSDRNGWNVDASLDSTFGLVPAVNYGLSRFLMAADRLRLRLAIGVPYRRYLFDAKPRFTWVYGELGLRYRSAAFARGTLGLGYEATGALSRYDRTDVGLRSFLAGRWSTLADLTVHAVRNLLDVSLGAGIGDIHLFAVDKVPSTATRKVVTPTERTRLRFLFRLAAELDFSPDAGAPARKRNLRAVALLALPLSLHPMLDLSVNGQYVFSFGYHDLILKARGLYLLGDVLFWDDQTLASDCQRVFFGNRYWVRRAAQAEVAARFGVWEDKVKLGLFHDLSVFSDRTRPGQPARVANSFGPSAHFLIFDQFQFDLYYGFGFSPSGFDHNLSLQFQSTF